MKICPTCNQRFADKNLNFCLEDGTLLQEVSEAAPTVFLDPPRKTSTDWNNQTATNTPFNNPLQTSRQNLESPSMITKLEGNNQTLPIISMSTGILGIMLACCSLGIPFGIAAAITGYIGYNNVNKQPEIYGGKNMAIGGMVLGIVSFVIGVGLLIISIIGSK